MSTLDAVLSRIDQDIDQSVERLFALLRIASVSTDPAYKEQCRAAAEHVAADLRSIGFSADVRPTEGHPVVVGKTNGVSGPRVLFYGHYDVQPVDPLNQWKTPPFEPRIETLPGGRKIIVARGACDDKGQAMTFIEACRAFKAVTGKLPLPITTMIEGEEECGSQNLFKFVRDNAAEFKLDLALVCDTAMWDAQTPAVTTSLRGLVYEDVKITCADRDLHSGVFGGAAQNPIRLLGQDSRRAVGRQWPRHHPRLLRRGEGAAGRHQGRPQGARPDAGEVPRPDRAEDAGRREGLSADRADHHAADRRDQRHHRRLHRRGRQDRHPGSGDRPKSRSAWSASRTRRKVRDNFRAFVRARLPADCQVEFGNFGLAPPLQLSFDNPALNKARAVLAEEWGHKAVAVGAGGSIPIVADFKSVLGMDSLLVGFALDDDRVHSPNEKFDLQCYHKGIRTWARILAALADA